MKVTFLIGNGFDINCGLKCQYKDVYRDYIVRDSRSINIEKFKREISENLDNWSDFEVEMSNYYSKCNTDDEFIECLRDFKIYLAMHLKKEEESFRNRYSGNGYILNKIKQEMETSFKTFFQDITNNLTTNIQNQINITGISFDFISFNYTEVFDDIYKIYLGSTEANNVIHIHGNLNETVLGMDNIEQFRNTKNGKLISDRAQRAFIKPVFNQQFDTYRVDKATAFIKESDIICSFGMSWGISDKTWTKLVLDWVAGNPSRQLFVYRYKDSKKSFGTIDERMDNEDEAKKNFLKEQKIEDSSEFFEQLHIPCGKNIFNIDTVIEEATEEYEDITREKENKRKAYGAYLPISHG